MSKSKKRNRPRKFPRTTEGHGRAREDAAQYLMSGKEAIRSSIGHLTEALSIYDKQPASAMNVLSEAAAMLSHAEICAGSSIAVLRLVSGMNNKPGRESTNASRNHVR